MGFPDFPTKRPVSDTAQNVPQCQANYGRAPCFVLCVAKAGGFRVVDDDDDHETGRGPRRNISHRIHGWYILFTYYYRNQPSVGNHTYYTVYMQIYVYIYIHTHVNRLRHGS